MKVKIVKTSLPTYWYVNHIGETFEVDDTGDAFGYRVINNKKFTRHCIQQEDFEIISEPVKIPFTFSAWDKDRSQKVWTRYGREVKQFTWFDCNSIVPLVGVVENDVMRWGVNGLWGSSVSKFDLFLEHTEKEYFVNVYRRENGKLYTKSADCHDSYNDASVLAGQADNYVKTISFKA